MTSEILQRLTLALAIGLLIGVERGWRERGGQSGSRAAGIRTHALIGLLGGIWGLIGRLFGDFTLGLGAVGFIAAFAAFEWREGTRNGNLSATGLVAGILTFALGIYAVRGDMAAAASVGVVATVILAEREMLHRFVFNLKWIELRNALLLLLMSVVLLPVMPNHTVDPWDTINPFEIWLVTILIAATSYGGYIAVRLAGSQSGPLFAGLAGGLVSSTTVTWTFARLARQQPGAGTALMAGILSSWTVSLLRMLALAALISPALLLPLAGPLLSAASVFVIVGSYLYSRGRKGTADASLKLEHPFELYAVLRFTVLIVAITLLSRWITPIFGQYGLFGVSAASGLADVDPVTFAMARATGKTIVANEAARVILTAALANVVAKCALATIFGRFKFGFPLLLTAAASAAAAGASLLT